MTFKYFNLSCVQKQKSFWCLFQEPLLLFSLIYSSTEEDGRKLKNIDIDLILKTIEGLVWTWRLKYTKMCFWSLKARKKVGKYSFPQLFLQVKNLNCFYSIFTKKRNSHGHFRYTKKHKIIPRNCCFSVINLCSPQRKLFLLYSNTSSSVVVHMLS